jgi:hypothetical protein
MKKLFSFFLCLSFSTIANTMEQHEQELTSIEIHEQQLSAVLKELPQDIGTHLVCLQLQDIHNQVNTIKEAHNYLVSVSFVNKFCNQYANNPTNTITFIRNLSQTITNRGGCAEIAQKLNTPGTRNYKSQSAQLFNTELIPDKIEQLKQQGADLDYTFSHHDNGLYSWPLHIWVVAKNYNNVKKLLELGADIDQSYPNSQQYSCVVCAFNKNTSELLPLLLSYKPKNTYLTRALQWYGRNEEVVLMLLNATKENNENVQFHLNDALIGALYTHDAIKPTQIKLLLDEGAQPEIALQKLTSWMLGHQATHSISVAPPLDILQLLCNYPVTNMTQVENAREVARGVKNMAEEILKILDSCTAKP